MERPVLTVTEVTRKIKKTLEVAFTTISVQGELSNVKLHSSGHVYFTLKDESAQISAVIWRSKVVNLAVTPADGMKVIATGRLTVYEIRGTYQLDVTSLKPVGLGELQAAFENLKQKLASEGLFDLERKRSLPPFPERIGIVTSPTGAAIQDMLKVLRRRFPCVEVILVPVKVQGPGAAKEIAGALDELNRFKEIDVMIVGRGGGSLEDLWAFNEEVVARAIYRSKIPVISAVGHEIDFTIADFVADLRAPTPSAAAEMVVKDKSALVELLRNNSYTMHENVVHMLDSHKTHIRHLLKSYSFNKPVDLLRQHSQRLDDLERGMVSSISHTLEIARARVNEFQHRASALNPRLVLHRGYTIVYKDGKIVRSSKKMRADDELEIAFHDGKIKSIVS
ncbi:MAG: exodeoxyribonuclease VII large subunit [Bacteroidota bacterium]